MSLASVTVSRLIRGSVIAAALLSSVAHAEEGAVARIGVLMPLGGDGVFEVALAEGLSALGYVEGKNLTFYWRRYEQSSEAIRSAAAELVQSRVDVVVANGTQAARAVLSETSTIPVVFLSADPIRAGLATSLAHPGANATGVSGQSPGLMAKRLQLLLQIAPRTRGVTLLVNPDSPLHPAFLEEAQKGAHTLGMRVATLNARNPNELDTALRGIQRHAGDAFVISPDTLFLVNKGKIAAAMRRAKLPAITTTKDYQGDGVLMSYGTSLNWMAHRAAGYADKILRGAKPADLPIEQASKIDLIIDLRVARELGLKVPQELLFRADEVIR